MLAPIRPILARRYFPRSRAQELEREFLTGRLEPCDNGARGYDILRDGWYELVLVADDDPRVNTVERFDA